MVRCRNRSSRNRSPLSYLFHYKFLRSNSAQTNQVHLLKVSLLLKFRELSTGLGQRCSLIYTALFDQVLHSHPQKCWSFQGEELMD